MHGFRSKRQVLGAFVRAFGNEIEVFARHPSLLWQQMHNRLQWENSSVRECLETALIRRTAKDGSIWLKTLIPFRESVALRLSLSGYDAGISQDSQSIIGIEAGQRIIWDSKTGARRYVLPLDGVNGLFAPAAKNKACPNKIVTLKEETLDILDLSTNETRHLPESHISDFIFGPDGQFILTASGQKLKKWDVASGELIFESVGHKDIGFFGGGIASLDISPDGQIIVTGGNDKTLKLWESASGKLLTTLWGHSKSVKQCQFSPDGSFLVSCGEEGKIKVWDVKKIRRKSGITKGHADRIRGCAMSTDGSFAVTASDDLTVRIWNFADGKPLAVLKRHTDMVEACAVSHSDDFIVSASCDGSLCIWDVKKHEIRLVLEGHQSTIFPNWVRDCAVSLDDAYILSASDDRTARIWDAESGQELGRRLWGHKGAVLACAISPDGAWIVTASEKILNVWDLEQRKRLFQLEGHSDDVSDCAVSPDNRYIVSGSADGTVRIWGVRSRSEISVLSGHRGAVTACGISPDGALVASVGFDETLKIWDVASSREMASVSLPGALQCIAWHPNSPRLICGDVGGVFYLIEIIGQRYPFVIATVIETSSGLNLPCPFCREQLAREFIFLGQEIRCPRANCGQNILINPFVYRNVIHSHLP